MLLLLMYLWGMLASIALTPLVIRVARSGNVLDLPGLRKVHRRAIPRLGGVAISLSVASVAIPIALGAQVLGIDRLPGGERILALLCCAMAVFTVGLVDDVRQVPARTKMLCQVLAAVAACEWGIRIESIDLGDWFSLELGWWSWPVTVLWIVGITNAVNLIDGLDGLAAGISAVACGVIAIFCMHSGQWGMAALMLAALGSLCGFLLFNFHPARIFLGDSGTYFLGFLLGGASVVSSAKASTIVGLALPALALGLPIFDTLFSMMRRWLNRRSVFAPDSSHIHHRLLKMGLRHRHVVLVLYGVTLMSASTALIMILASGTEALVVFIAELVLLVLVFKSVGVVALRQGLSMAKRNLHIARAARQDTRNFENAQLRLNDVFSFEDWWQGVCGAAGDLGLQRVWLHSTDRTGRRRVLVWSTPNYVSNSGHSVKIAVPVRDRRAGSTLRGEVEIPVNGSLEAAGRKAWLFSRLMDEQGVSQLPRRSAPQRPWISPPQDDPAQPQQAERTHGA